MLVFSIALFVGRELDDPHWVGKSFAMTLKDFKPIDFKSRFQICVWEHKNLNHHRAVLHLKGNGETFGDESFATLLQEIASQIAISRMRGFSFGIYLEDFDASEQQLLKWVDDRVKSGRACSWIVASKQEGKTMSGCHMWMKGLTTPIYEEFLKAGKKSGFTTTNTVRQPEGLMKFGATFMPALRLSRYQPTEKSD